MKRDRPQHLLHQQIVLGQVFGRREYLEGQHITGVRRRNGGAKHGIAPHRLAGIEAQEFMTIDDLDALAGFLHVFILGFQTG